MGESAVGQNLKFCTRLTYHTPKMDLVEHILNTISQDPKPLPKSERGIPCCVWLEVKEKVNGAKERKVASAENEQNQS